MGSTINVDGIRPLLTHLYCYENNCRNEGFEGQKRLIDLYCFIYQANRWFEYIQLIALVSQQ